MRKIFDTKHFGAHHIVGAGVLVLGTYGMARWLISRHRDQVAIELARAHAAANRANAQISVRGYYN